MFFGVEMKVGVTIATVEVDEIMGVVGVEGSPTAVEDGIVVDVGVVKDAAGSAVLDVGVGVSDVGVAGGGVGTEGVVGASDVGGASDVVGTSTVVGGASDVVGTSTVVGSSDVEDVPEVEEPVELDPDEVDPAEVDPAEVDPDEVEPADAEDPPALKMTMLAVIPLGMVATQKSAPPAPLAASSLVTSFMPFTDGSMEQGRPLQPWPSHSILSPKVGIVLAKLLSV